MYIGIEAHIDEAGRIVIPKNYRTVYGLKPHTKVNIIGTEEGLLIRPGSFKMVLVTDEN